MTNKAMIKEIFASIQGEGLYIGTKQLFVRFCNCNLNCDYCDTEHLPQNSDGVDDYLEFTPDELIEYINNEFDISTINYVSLTGGEPLLWSDFLTEFLSKINLRIYLETNATVSQGLEKVLNFVEVISADIKLPSCSGVKNSFSMHDKFFNVIKNYKVDCAITRQYDCDGKKVFAKIVFDEKITDDEIFACVELAKKYNLELILQPKMDKNILNIESTFMSDILDKFLHSYNKVRLIPQVHKFLNVE